MWLPLGTQEASSGSSFCLFIFWMGEAYEEASLVAQMVKNLPAMWETWVQSLGQEDIPEKGMATHSSILAWGILCPSVSISVGIFSARLSPSVAKCLGLTLCPLSYSRNSNGDSDTETAGTYCPLCWETQHPGGLRGPIPLIFNSWKERGCVMG